MTFNWLIQNVDLKMLICTNIAQMVQLFQGEVNNVNFLMNAYKTTEDKNDLFN